VTGEEHLPPGAAAALRCPDCLSDAEVVEALPGVWVANVYHDPTCPTLAAIEGRDK
jgi:hypothetical protein